MVWACVVALHLSPTPQRSSVARRSHEDDAWSRELPGSVVSKLQKRGIEVMTAVQRAAWGPVFERLDAVVQSPTATGKTLAYVLPLCARLASTAVPKKGGRGSVAPRAVVLAPSRELAVQIGREFEVYGDVQVATIYGGAPLERAIAALRSKGGADVVVSTGGRLVEMIRRGDLSMEAVETLILDEADLLLDAEDAPEVAAVLEDMDHDYQLVLFSATITKAVRRYARGAMEVCHDAAFVDRDEKRRDVKHEVAAVVEAEWTSAAADVLAARAPRLALVFVRAIAQAKDVEDDLRRVLWYADVFLLHGDMDGAARRTVLSRLRNRDLDRQAVLVSTDVASRGLDLPGVDLVLHMGLPRKAGRPGTLDPVLYQHRSGRAGREADSLAESLVFYDPAAGEAKLLAPLEDATGYEFERRPLPTPDQLLDAALNRSYAAASQVPHNSLAHIARRLPDVRDDLALRALAALAGFSPGQRAAPDLRHRSVLTARRSERTLHFRAPVLSASQVTKACKALGSGKLSTVRLGYDNTTALVDVPITKLDAIVASASRDGALPPGWTLTVLPSDEEPFALSNLPLLPPPARKTISPTSVPQKQPQQQFDHLPPTETRPVTAR